MGLEYGPAHQGIETVYTGNNQVLAKLEIPSSVNDTQDPFVLHPSIMDSALQAAIGLAQLQKMPAFSAGEFRNGANST